MRRLILAGAVFALGGCAALPPPCPAVVFPPAVYLQDVRPPIFTGTTNADLAAYVLDLRQAVERSNMDKARLREFYAN
jgi:hypothetical protein